MLFSEPIAWLEKKHPARAWPTKPRLPIPTRSAIGTRGVFVHKNFFAFSSNQWKLKEGLFGNGLVLIGRTTPREN